MLGLRYDRWSLCPECDKFTILGEFFTPKELQKAKFKVCPGCEKTIEEVGFLVKPTTGRSLSINFVIFCFLFGTGRILCFAILFSSVGLSKDDFKNGETQ